MLGINRAVTEREDGHMTNGNAKTGKYQALRRRAEIVEARLARIVSLEAQIQTCHSTYLHHLRMAAQLRAELSGLIRLGFSEGETPKK